MPREPAATLTGPHARAPRWVVAGCGLIATLVLSEAIARLEGPVVCASDTAVLLAADPEVGWTFAPGLTVEVQGCSPDRGEKAWPMTVSINREGLADQEWPVAKRPGEVRIVVLGNERADGVGLDRADRLSVRFSHLADRVRGARVAGINAAIPGYTPREALRWLVRRGVRYSPDVVVLLLDPVRDLAASIDPPRIEPVPATDPPASGLLSWAVPARRVDGAPATPPAGAVRIGEPRALASPDERQRARERTVATIAEIAAAARDAGATLAVAVAPPCPAVPYETDLCDAIAAVAPCVDLAPAFEEVRRSRGDDAELCVAGTGRWGRDAHFVASHRIWSLLEDRSLWPTSVRRGYRL
jgi:hypothetical protein